MNGMNPATGRAAADNIEAIRISIGEILMTPIGTRLMRRDFGSYIPRLLDQPLIAPTIILLYAAAAMAIMAHEDRVTLTHFDFTGEGATATLEITAVERATGADISLSVPLLQAAS